MKSDIQESPSAVGRRSMVIGWFEWEAESQSANKCYLAGSCYKTKRDGMPVR